ncbi:spermidine synthase [Saccharobesus litoralis]|uniref:Polyamine aminopropyltransferase n=1 Tax=Saccharobesus litoralis TaxID=2172099 RepID=A0A2S0VRF3_9ALTE|nr:polyamine aminopropyltransferase [Saccharobesus litoralis]AWB66791.1 spermidine synthase [Saccharobesus litoralis]
MLSILQAARVNPQLFIRDSLLILVMAMLAGCGLVYEYLLSQYAGRVLGAFESAVYTMIGLMIVSMGLGAFAARKVKDAYKGFVYLEIVIAILGAGSVLAIAGLIGWTYTLPQVLADTFGIPPDALPRGGWFGAIHKAALQLPYIAGVLLGLFIGMEIPLIARVREQMYGEHLTHNAGTIYGADYIGAGIGAAIWISLLMSMEISQAAAWTASINVLAGFLFLVLYWQKLVWRKLLVVIHLGLAVMVCVIGLNGQSWLASFTDALYKDQVVFQQQTQYQQIVFTERQLGPEINPVHQFYLNGRLQFSSQDEYIYHEMLVHPVMALSARQDNILIIGGGDGLALREVLKWQPKQVTLVDLDPQLTHVFQQPNDKLPQRLAQQVTQLTQNSLNDPRVSVINHDAFLMVDELLQQQKSFDSIIVDLPDPNHPDLNKLYSRHFYLRLNQLLAADGGLVVQSTSPYHAKHAFLAIGKTLRASEFQHVEQYHQNVPSFGEWGWTLAHKLVAPQQNLKNTQLPISTKWLTPSLLQASFAFPSGYFDVLNDIQVNDLGSHVLYQYHYQAWRQQLGTVFQ